MITWGIVVLIITTICLYLKKKYSYWRERGVKHDAPLPFFGNNLQVYFFRKTISQLAEEWYWKYANEKVIGYYRGVKPELIIRDPEIVKIILQTDFQHFHPRGTHDPDEAKEPMFHNLFFTDGDMWKLLRQRMTPAFTSGKLKAMFPLIVERAERLRTRTLTLSLKGEAIDAKDLMARYTTDFIGACGFGVEADSLNDDDSEFRKLGRKIFEINTGQLFLLLLKEFFPIIFRRMLIFTALQKDLDDFVSVVLKKRNYQPSGRGDFIDLLLECKKKGTIVGDSIEKYKADGTPEQASLEFTDDVITAQVVLFYAAGFETSSSASSHALHQLAHNPEVQAKAQQEIDRVLAKYDNKLCYDAIKEMKYLEMVFKEGLRILPSLGVLNRQCARKYTFPELGLTIDEGVRIVIPVQAMHTDPQYFSEPLEFRPERFEDEHGSANKYVYLPFGEGPRACIGARLGLMQSVAGLAAVLSEFSVSPAPGAPKDLILDPMSDLIQSVKGGLPLMFTKRNTAAQ